MRIAIRSLSVSFLSFTQFGLLVLCFSACCCLGPFVNCHPDQIAACSTGLTLYLAFFRHGVWQRCNFEQKVASASGPALSKLVRSQGCLVSTLAWALVKADRSNAPPIRWPWPAVGYLRTLRTLSHAAKRDVVANVGPCRYASCAEV